MKKKPEPEEDDFEKLLEVDEYDLPREIRRQAKRYYRVSRLLADARYDQAEAASELEAVRAETAMNIRQMPAAFDVAKVTDSSVKEALEANPKVRKFVRKLNRAKRRVDLLKGLVDGMDQKRSMLENIVRLQLGGLYASPQTDEKRLRRA